MSGEVLENLKKAVMNYNSEQAVNWARMVAQERIDPIRALNVMTETMRQIGDAFGRGELWLPDLVGAADTMQAAMPVVEEEIKKRGMSRETLGSVVLGTVYGDIHSIGKTMVCVLLTAEGFAVRDLGVNVLAEEFVEAVQRYKVDILAMSSLMTTTAPEQKKVIDTLVKKGLRDKVKIMVGGGAITPEFANDIGADGYEATAPGAAQLAKKLITPSILSKNT